MWLLPRSIDTALICSCVINWVRLIFYSDRILLVSNNDGAHLNGMLQALIVSI